jgi:hypothetical protein
MIILYSGHGSEKTFNPLRGIVSGPLGRKGNKMVTHERLRQKELEMEMKVELEKIAEKWVKEEVARRMGSVGVDEGEVTKQVELEADRWLKWNLERRAHGLEGTASPSDGVGHLTVSNPGSPEW